MANKAKENFIQDIVKLLPEDAYVGEFNGKHYFWSHEDGKRVQVALSLTCPKNPVEAVINPIGLIGGGIDFEVASQPIAMPTVSTEEMSVEEINRVKLLMEKLGL